MVVRFFFFCRICKFAIDSSEAFRIDPMSAVIKLVERRVLAIKNIFKAKKSFFYFVDEFVGVPLCGLAHSPYPLELNESNTDYILSRILPFMHSCSVAMMNTSGGISGKAFLPEGHQVSHLDKLKLNPMFCTSSDPKKERTAASSDLLPMSMPSSKYHD